MIWLDWMPHIRSLKVDTQILLKLTPTIKLNGTINRFSSLETLIVDHPNTIPDDDTLTAIAQLGMSSSLRDIHVYNYKILHSQSIDESNFVSNVSQIIYNMCKLETLTIEFATPHSLFDSTTLEELTFNEERTCQHECIYVSEDTIQFWLER
jgi:hypothetical protein